MAAAWIPAGIAIAAFLQLDVGWPAVAVIVASASALGALGCVGVRDRIVARRRLRNPT